MTHFDEMNCLLYLDGQLDTEKTKELELHLRSCTPCRSLLAALQRESALLHQAMVEEEESVPARLLAPPGRESMPWGWIVSLGFAALGAFTLWTEIIGPWQNNLSQAGFGGGNLLAMLFFSGVFWKGWSDMTIALQVLAAATLGAPVLYLLWKKRRSLKPVALVMCAMAMLLLPSGAQAAEIIKKDFYTLEQGQTLNNDLIIFCGTVKIEGTLEGDLIAFGETVDIKGHVTGDVIVFAKRLNISGTVEGSLRSFANSALISGTVTRSVTAFLEGFEATSEARLGRGAMIFGDSMTLAGRFERDLMVYAKRASLEGYVGGNFSMRGETLRIASSAEVLGTTKYRGRKDPEVAAGAKLASPLVKETPQRKPEHLSGRFYWDVFLGFCAILALGSVVLLVSPRGFKQVAQAGRKPASLLGVVVLFVVPVAALLVCITLIGIPVGLISLVLWAILIYAGQIYVGAALGEMILGASTSTGGSLGRMALGLAIIRTVGVLRYVFLPGGATWLVFWGLIAAWGLGAVTLAIYEQVRWKPQPSAPTPAAVFGSPAS